MSIDMAILALSLILLIRFLYSTSLAYPSVSVQALWLPSSADYEEEILLLVPSDLSNSGGKALQYGNIACRSYRYNKNIPTTETATG